MTAPLVHVSPVSPVLERGVRAVTPRPEQVAHVGNTAFNLSDALGDPDSDAMAILADGKVIGFYRLDRAPADWLAPGAIVIRHLVIDAAHQGQGLGRRAVQALLRDIGKRHPDCRLLGAEITRGNHAALAIAAGNGFVSCGGHADIIVNQLRQHRLMRMMPRPGGSYLYV